MLGLAKRLKIKILQASTSEVYGDPSVHPQPETYWGNVNPIGPRSCYDEGKRCAETLFFDYRRQNGLPIKVVRIFNTYGPRMHPNDGRVVSSFIVQALRNEDVTVFGDGEQTRSFCYVDDLILGITKDDGHGRRYRGTRKSGNPEEFSMRELAEIVRSIDGLAIEDCAQASTERRPAPEATRYQRGRAAAQLETGHAPKRRLTKDHSLFRGAPLTPRRLGGGSPMTAPAVLVTGGAGYVGAHACKALARAGYIPVTYDNLSTGHESFVRWGPLVPGDIRDYARLRETIRSRDITAVLHFAACAYVGESVIDPQKYYDNNVWGHSPCSGRCWTQASRRRLF